MARLASFDTLAPLMVAAFSIAALGLHAVTMGPSPPDGVGSVFALYQSVRSALPAAGAVGFIPTTPDPTASVEIRFVVQYALAPLVLVDDVTTAPVVITGPAAPASVDQAMDGSGLALDRVLPGGVRLYRPR